MAWSLCQSANTRWVTENEGHKKCKTMLGNGKVVHSTKKVKIPTVIAQTRCQIETSCPSRYPIAFKQNFTEKSRCSLGHWEWQSPYVQATCETWTDIVRTLLCEHEGWECPRWKWHPKWRWHSHCDKKHENNVETAQAIQACLSWLEKLLACSGNNDEECTTILKDIVKNCETCIRYSKPKQKPAIHLPMASTYNDTVAMELHEQKPGVWYLYATSHASVQGALLPPKNPERYWSTSFTAG